MLEGNENNSIELLAYVSRYIVPFYFEYENDGYSKIAEYFKSNDYNAVEHLLPAGTWSECGFWENYKTEDESNPETDVYTYLLNLYRKDDKDYNIGTSFIYKPQNNNKIFNYINENSLEISCTDLGLILYKNGIGFFWYETSMSPAYDKENKLDLQKYVDFQNKFKELSRAECTVFDEYQKSQELYLGEWIKKVLSIDETGIKFWEKRTVIGSNGIKIDVPDKALLFQYVFVDGYKENAASRDSMAFLLSNGFGYKYNVPYDVSDDTYNPFGNASFFISKGGLAYVVSDDKTNSHFFRNFFLPKFKGDYFFIYLLLLYQSYSCSHYSRLLTKLPANKMVYFEDDKNLEKLESLDYQIQLFLVKSTYESVSNIHHQNEVYKYGERMLYTHDDMTGVTTGLSALKNLIRFKHEVVKADEVHTKQEIERKKNNNISVGLAFFGMLVVFSLGIDALNLVDRIEQGNLAFWHYITLGVIGIFGLITVIIVIINSFNKNE